VSAETLGPEAHFFRTEGPQLLKLAGRTTPLPTYRILGRSDTSTRFEARARRGLSTFVGRESELAELAAGLQDAAAGKPTCVAMVAPAGTGKTRLAEEFLRLARSRDCEVLRGYCESYLGAEPAQPFMQMLRAVLGLEPGMALWDAVARVDERLAGIDPDLAAHRALLHQVLMIEAEPAADRATPEQALRVLRELFAKLAARKPTVLFIDDWQWADQASHIVAGAIQSIRGGILLIAAMREFDPNDASLGQARVLRLAPLSEEEAEVTIARLLPGVDPFVAAGIRRDAGGNALFLEELCHNARQSAGEQRVASPPGSAAWLDALIESRLAALPEDQAEIARTASVIGNVIPAWLLEKLTGCGESHPRVQALAAQDFIYPAADRGVLRFKHGIARDAIYAAVGLRERRALHARIAEALRASGAEQAREDHLESLAYHYRAAGNAVEAARFAELAGDKALAASALDRAQAQYRTAIESLDQLGTSAATYARWRSIAKRLASACVYDPAREQLALFARAVALAVAHDDAGGAANAEYWLGYINYALGEARTAIRHFESALGKAEAKGEASLVAQLRATLGQARAAACDYPAALANFDAALQLKREHRSSSTPSVGSAYTLACKAAVLGDQGHFGDAAECFAQALESLRGVHHVVEGSVLCLQSSVLLWQGRWEEARQSAATAEKLAGRVKSLYFLAMSRSLGGYADWMLKGDAAAIQAIADATSWLESRDRGLFISLNHGWLADALAARGDVAGMRRHMGRALRRAHKGDRLGEAMAWRAMARLAAAGKVQRPVAACLARAMRAAEARGSPHEVAVNQLCAAELAAERGARDEARALFEQASAAFERMGMQWHLARANRISESVC
jgi:tetratricopeptide (TPR) repeat protein